MQPKKKTSKAKAKANAQGDNKSWKEKKLESSQVRRSVREIEELEKRIESGAPKCGSNPLAETLPLKLEVDPRTGYKPYSGAKRFDQLPLSESTLKGLQDSKYETMTEIQRAALPHALCGRDVLGAAKTGSGKTLTFLIPVIEKLNRLRWGTMDGIGALIISPTRELAGQIFDQLRKVGKYHSFSGGLLIGGRKEVKTEKEHVNSLNIVVCTPGRLLQHMHETVNFDCSQLQLLVLDEADRILDMGFAATLNQILQQIPKERQTFLFSATQTRSVQDLARLSLQSPEYLAVHAESTEATPARLHQTAMIIPIDQKIDTLWSFIKSHLRNKMLVFLSSCKQVKFVYEAFKRMRPGVPLSCLHGRQKQGVRMEAFYKFCEAQHAVLFATDIAARGLDFPTVDWVVQVDCPDDVATYIHRAGRTARYTSSGSSLLLLAPSESKMLTLLEESKIPIKVLKPNASKLLHVSQVIGGLLARDTDLKYMAQRSFITYLRSIYVQRNKEVFDVQKLPVAEYAASLGLPSVPQVRFLKKTGKNVCYAGNELEEKKTNGTSKTEDEDTDDDDVFLKRKRPVDEEKTEEVVNPKKRKLKIDVKKATGRRVVFDDEGNAATPFEALTKQGNEPETTDKDVVDEELAAAAEERYKKLHEEMKKRDREDKVVEKRWRQKKREKKKKNQKSLGGDEEAEAPRLAGASEDDSQSFEESDVEDENDDSPKVDSLSLAEQEALARKLLSSRKS